MRVIGDALAIFASVGGVALFFTYAFLTPWYRSPYGRNLMLLIFVLAVAFTLIATNLVFGTTWPARDLIRATIFALIGISLWGFQITLVRQQVRYFRKKAADEMANEGIRE